MTADLTPEEMWAERDRRVAALRDTQLEEIRQRLPLSDPDRQDLDADADEAFAHLAPGYPDTSSPTDFAASVAAEYLDPDPWADCEPAFPAATKVADVETGGRL